MFYLIFTFLILLLHLVGSDALIVYSELYDFAYCTCPKCGSTAYTAWLWEILAGSAVNVV